ncbi:MAG: tetratricopeptide repeat protein [Acidobacteria bacterium]|nr:tetratricopeptide repeat protein [Acidobacteriota bacterium]
MKRILWAGVAPLLLASTCSRHHADLSAARRNTPRTQPAMQRQIDNAVDAGEGDLVVKALREKMSADPQNLEPRLQLAAHYRQLGHTELAVEHYRLALDRFPDNARVVLLLAQTLQEQNSTRQAADLIDRFLAAHPPKNSDLPAWLGILRDQLGDLPRAESAHRAALALNPSNAKLHNNLGYNLLMQDKRPEAIEEFRRALAFDPAMHTARNNLGLALMREGSAADRQEALKQWSQAGTPAAAHTNLAAVLIDQGQYAEARQELAAALGYDRNYLPALKNMEVLASLEGKSTVSIPARPQKKQSAFRFMAWKVWQAVAGVESKPPTQQRVTLAVTE